MIFKKAITSLILQECLDILFDKISFNFSIGKHEDTLEDIIRKSYNIYSRRAGYGYNITFNEFLDDHKKIYGEHEGSIVLAKLQYEYLRNKNPELDY